MDSLSGSKNGIRGNLNNALIVKSIRWKCRINPLDMTYKQGVSMGNGHTDTHTQINYCKTDRWLPGIMRKEKVYSDMALLCRQRTSLKVFNTLTDVMKRILYNNQYQVQPTFSRWLPVPGNAKLWGVWVHPPDSAKRMHWVWDLHISG